MVNPPNKCSVTIMGKSFKLTVKYPKTPWQHIKNNRNDDQPCIDLSFVFLKDR